MQFDLQDISPVIAIQTLEKSHLLQVATGIHLHPTAGTQTH